MFFLCESLNGNILGYTSVWKKSISQIIPGHLPLTQSKLAVPLQKYKKIFDDFSVFLIFQIVAL